MLNGGPPFTGRDRNEAKKAVCRGKLKLKRQVLSSAFKMSQMTALADVSKILTSVNSF